MAAETDHLPRVSDPTKERLGVGGDDVSVFQSALELESLRKRVKELESENELLMSWISACRRCSKIPAIRKDDLIFPGRATKSPMEPKNNELHGDGAPKNGEFHSRDAGKPTGSFSTDSSIIHSGIAVNQLKDEVEQVNDFSEAALVLTKGETMSGCQLRSVHHHKRYVALKVMYFGQRFYGFASEAQMDPTIESEIFKALGKTNLLVSNKENLNYSRCGRTDKGVSSTGQVISLYLRSSLKDNGASKDGYEIDYVKVLNRALPKDIRVMGWCPVSANFHSRFSCLSRVYKYHFWRGALDIEAMQSAGKKFIGEHDFRNFCKMDALNVSNYRRRITFFEISSCTKRSDDDVLYAMTIRGTAFLWHQVRCMVAVLFMIGQGLESPTIIDALLDTSKTPRKPQYIMAPDLPLLLQSCEFEDISFLCSSDAGKALVDDLNNAIKTYKLQAAIFREALDSVSIPGETLFENVKRRRGHIPLMTRPTEPSYEERRAKFVLKSNSRTSTTSNNSTE